VRSAVSSLVNRTHRFTANTCVDDDIARLAAEKDKTGQMRAMLDTIFLTPAAAASKLVDIIVASTREKDGGQFHNSDDGRHPW
jgi:hypothetical protein